MRPSDISSMKQCFLVRCLRTRLTRSSPSVTHRSISVVRFLRVNDALCFERFSVLLVEHRLCLRMRVRARLASSNLCGSQGLRKNTKKAVQPRVIVVGCKSDLADKRQVHMDELKKQLSAMGNVEYFECTLLCMRPPTYRTQTSSQISSLTSLHIRRT